MEDLISFWGYEFYPEEWREPASLGGWISPTFMGVRLDCINRDLTFEKKMASIAVSDGCHLYKKRKKLDKRLFNSPLRQIYGDSLIVGEANSRLFYTSSKADVYYTISRWKSREAYENAFRDLKIKRQQIYKDHTCPLYFGIKGFYDFLVKSYPEKDFLPPRELVLEERFIEPSYRTQFREWVNPNPMLGFLKYHNPGLIGRHVIPERKSWIYRSNNKQLTSFERKQIARYNSATRGNQIIQFPESELPFFVTDEGSKEWYNEHKVMAAYSTIFGVERLPLLKEREILSEEERRVIFYFSFKESGKALDKLCQMSFWDTTEHILNLSEKPSVELAEIIHDQFVISFLEPWEYIHKDIDTREETPEPEQETQVLGWNDYWSFTYNRDALVETEVLKQVWNRLDHWRTVIEAVGDTFAGGLSPDDIRKAMREDPNCDLMNLTWIRSGGRLDPSFNIPELFLGTEDVFGDSGSDVGLGLDW
jgi:hypothetical protein